MVLSTKRKSAFVLAAPVAPTYCSAEVFFRHHQHHASVMLISFLQLQLHTTGPRWTGTGIVQDIDTSTCVNGVPRWYQYQYGRELFCLVHTPRSNCYQANGRAHPRVASRGSHSIFTPTPRAQPLPCTHAPRESFCTADRREDFRYCTNETELSELCCKLSSQLGCGQWIVDGQCRMLTRADSPSKQTG